jgi:hypothetical protein
MRILPLASISAYQITDLRQHCVGFSRHGITRAHSSYQNLTATGWRRPAPLPPFPGRKKSHWHGSRTTAETDVKPFLSWPSAVPPGLSDTLNPITKPQKSARHHPFWYSTQSGSTPRSMRQWTHLDSLVIVGQHGTNRPRPRVAVVVGLGREDEPGVAVAEPRLERAVQQPHLSD